VKAGFEWVRQASRGCLAGVWQGPIFMINLSGNAL